MLTLLLGTSRSSLGPQSSFVQVRSKLREVAIELADQGFLDGLFLFRAG